MEKLFDETYAGKGGKRSSRNIWYGYAEMSVDDEYGKIFRPNDGLTDDFCAIIRNNLAENPVSVSAETNWYFYGSAVTQDAIGDNIRPVVMVRERDGEFVVNCNISDYDFAVNLDTILLFKADLEKRLARQ